MKRMLKKLFTAVLIGTLMATLVACGNNAASGNTSEESVELPEEINFGYLRVPNDETLAIAEGIFDEYFTEKGIKCNFIIFDSGVQANQALASGSIDFATMGNTNAIIALARDIDVEMIWIHEVLGEIEALAVKDGSGIETMDDLVGMQVATPFASTSHYVLLNALKEAGIEEDVQLLDMKTPEIVAAWERGDIEAAYTWQPSLGKLLEDGSMLVSSADMAEKGYITANVEVVRKGFAEQYPELVADFITCMTKAGDMYREDPEKAAESIAAELEIEADDALMQMRGSIWCTPEELNGADYFGTIENPGNFAVIMKDTSDFLMDQSSIDNSPSGEAFNDYVNPAYIEMYLENNSK
jgi:taurine transport system substrate-binding protein